MKSADEAALRRAMAVFLGRGGLGLALAGVSTLILIGLRVILPDSMEAWMVIAGAAIGLAVTQLVVATSRRARSAVEGHANGALEDLG